MSAFRRSLLSHLTSHLSPSPRDLSSVALAEAEALAEGGSLLSTVIQACHTEQHNEEPVFTGKFFTPDQGCVMDLAYELTKEAWIGWTSFEIERPWRNVIEQFNQKVSQ